MKDISQKSLGFLMDSLVTTNLRCWFAQEKIMNTSLSEHQRLSAAIIAQQQNAIRSELIKEIRWEQKFANISNNVSQKLIRVGTYFIHHYNLLLKVLH
jgi:hypothetical protein